MRAAVSLGASAFLTVSPILQEPPINACILIPVYDHGHAIGAVIEQLRDLNLPGWLIDDGSSTECRQVLEALALRESSWLHLERLPHNQGKGFALAHGFDIAAAAGYSHALQIDADGQHAPADAARLLEQAREHPNALITGVPIYDSSVPKARLYGRYVTHFWVWVNTASFAIQDSMCGFRVYPLSATTALYAAERVGHRMDFDTDIIVRLYWRGTEVINVPTRVHYPLDGVSHFRMWQDNVRITLMHTRLFFTMLARRCGFGPRITSPVSAPRDPPNSRKN